MSQKAVKTKQAGKGKPAELPGWREVTLTFNVKVRAMDATTDEQIADWRRWAELYARVLEASDCPESFSRAFGAIFFDHILRASGLDLTGPDMVRVLFPLALIEADSSIPATAEGVTDTLATLLDTLCGPEMTERIRAELAAEGK